MIFPCLKFSVEMETLTESVIPGHIVNTHHLPPLKRVKEIHRASLFQVHSSLSSSFSVPSLVPFKSLLQHLNVPSSGQCQFQLGLGHVPTP